MSWPGSFIELDVPGYTTIRTGVVHARERLRARLDGLRRRVTHARGYVASPWIRFGSAAAVGYLLGRREHEEPDVRAASPLATREPIVHAVVRAALVAVVNSAIRRALADTGTNREKVEMS